MFEIISVSAILSGILMGLLASLFFLYRSNAGILELVARSPREFSLGNYRPTRSNRRGARARIGGAKSERNVVEEGL